MSCNLAVVCLIGNPMNRFLGLALLLCPALLAAENPPEAGTLAPAFRLPAQDGSPVTLEEFRGKWVVLYFYPRDGTRSCTIQARNFQRDLARYESLNAVIIGISVDPVDRHEEFCAQEGLTFKLLSDTDKEVSGRYGSLRNLLGIRISARNTFLIDPDGKIAKVWMGVNVRPHSEEVLAALRELAAR